METFLLITKHQFLFFRYRSYSTSNWVLLRVSMNL